MRRWIARFPMPQPILSHDTARPYPLKANRPPAIVGIAILWLTFACALPLHQLRETRRQLYQDLLHTLAADKPDTGILIAAFDHSNQKIEAAAFGPCF